MGKKAKTLSSYDKHQNHAGPSWIFRIGRSSSGTPARHVPPPRQYGGPQRQGMTMVVAPQREKYCGPISWAICLGVSCMGCPGCFIGCCPVDERPIPTTVYAQGAMPAYAPVPPAPQNRV